MLKWRKQKTLGHLIINACFNIQPKPASSFVLLIVIVKSINKAANGDGLFKENLREAEYKMVVANLCHDFREAVNFNLRRNKIESSKHVAEVPQQVFDNDVFICAH